LRYSSRPARESIHPNEGLGAVPGTELATESVDADAPEGQPGERRADGDEQRHVEFEIVF
jgi:hypothetical protein